MPRIYRVVLLTASVLYLCSVFASGDKCSPQAIRQLADYQARSILSPGYPQNYETNDDCTWVIEAVTTDKGYAIQLVPVEIDLNDYKKDCNTDFLEAYEGKDTTGQLLARWCGHDRKVVKSTSQHITLKFHSDEQYTGKGFAIYFSLVRYASAECVEGQADVLHIGNAPVYESFRGKSSVESCEWKIQSDDPDKKLVLELFKPSDISCDDGTFDFYDGGDTSSHVSFQYCSSKKPFSTMYLLSSEASLAFRRNAVMSDEPDDVILKISARSAVYDCTVSNLPTLEVRGGPIVFSFPFSKNQRMTPCPVRLWAPDENTYLRLDVMGTDEGEADCDTDVITVTGSSSQEEVRRSCSRGKNPVYRHGSDEGLIVKGTTQSAVFMRAAAVHSLCNGDTMRLTAYNDLIVEDMVPRSGGYTDLSYCKILITADQEDEIISLSIDWKLPLQEHYPYTEEALCQGDFINVYDGYSEASPVLFSSCRQEDRPAHSVDTTVISSKNQILLIMDADARIEGEAFTIKYHSIPGGERCTEDTEITINRDPKTVTSLNYPQSLPMNQVCTYHLISEEPDDEVVVKVIETDLQDHCRSILLVYEGKYEFGKGGKVVGRVCGKDTPTFRIPSKTVSLLALSEDYSGPGGWRVEVHTEEKTDDNNNSATSSSKFSLLCLSLVFAFRLLAS